MLSFFKFSKSGHKNILEPETRLCGSTWCRHTRTPAIKKSHEQLANESQSSPKHLNSKFRIERGRVSQTDQKTNDKNELKIK